MKRTFYYSLLLALIISGCTGGTVPETVNTGIAPADVDIDATKVAVLKEAIIAGKFRNLHSVIVMKDNKLVFEEYFGDFDSESLQFSASISKSVGSMLLGVAIQQKLVPSLEDGLLDKPLAEIFPEYRDILTTDERKRSILFRHLLSMTAGFEWDEHSYPYHDSRNDWNKSSTSPEPAKFLFSKPTISDPGQVFNYNGGLSLLVSEYLQKVTGQSASDFAKQHLFGPLGISDYEWTTVTSGLTDTDGGLHLRPKDLAKLGQLYLDGGKWNGKQIIPEKWVKESVKAHVVNDNSPDYGLQWWCGDYHYSNRSTYVYLASGFGGQAIFVIPKFNAVVVITQEVFNNQSADLSRMSIMSKHVLPALDGEFYDFALTSLDDEEQQLYAGTYASNGDTSRMEIENGKLILHIQSLPPLELLKASDGLLIASYMNLVDMVFEFDIDQDGKVLGGRSTVAFRKSEFTKQ